MAFDRPATGVDVDTVLADNRGGIGQAFEHLTRQGHRRIAYIGDDERIFTGSERATAFRDHLRMAGMPLDGMVHPGPVNQDRIAAALAAIRHQADPATAIITGNAGTTIALIRALGGDVETTALVGFDDLPLADLLRPGLTVVAQDVEQIGNATVDLFRARLADRTRPVQRAVIPTNLVVRGSGELPP